MLILGIESSCDETAWRQFPKTGRKYFPRSYLLRSRNIKKYGGVVPEIASRRHCENILGVVKKSLKDAGKTLDEIDAVAVTYARDS